ncbi:MAG: hypothetical protein KJ964_02540 [Verrucomicrobia bacterium]|nr:hypothetical protein [Verrucomicrobiota bacterium]MBU1734012.1 hypothetical protein [Verrucomicrobiota bacterium]MBU1857108.1 hypothetical protein [Verrucomicrobiota bacterium]
MADAVQIMRKALYRRVWSEPVSKLSKEFGLSDVGFAKLCKRNDIPRPPRGHWAKKSAGYKTVARPLPRTAEDWEIKIKPHEAVIQNPALRAEAEKELAAAAQDEPIVVLESLRGSHDLVSQSLHALEIAGKNEYGLLKVPEAGCLDVLVSKNSLRRALLIIDALIKTFEGRGYKVKVAGKDVKGTVVELMKTQVPFGISERLEAKQEEVDDNSDLKGRYEFRHSKYQLKTVPSGELILEIDPHRSCYYRASGLRRKWSDGKSGRIEGYLDQFVAGVINVASAKREIELEHERWEHDRQEAEKQRAEKERDRAAIWAKIQKERAKVNKLEADAAAWEEARQIRTYIETVKQDALTRGKDVGKDSELGKWIAWALQQADRMDPLKESPPSILNDEEKYRPPEQQRSSW